MPKVIPEVAVKLKVIRTSQNGVRTMQTPDLTILATATSMLGLAACGSDTGPAGPRVEVETIGDTTIVRTLSGSRMGGGGEARPGSLDR